MGKLVAGDDSDLFGLLRLTALQNTFSSHYRYCRVCAEEELANLGEPYWHRLAQIQGISHCPTHGTLMFVSEVPLLARKSRELQAASSAVAVSRLERRIKAPVVFSQELQGDVVLLAKMTLDADSFGARFGRDSTRLMLRRLGYAAPRGQVRASSLSNDFRAFLRAHTARSNALLQSPWWLGMFTAACEVSPLGRHVFMVFLRRLMEAENVKLNS